MSTTLPRTAVIGAGSSGIAALKKLRQAGIDAVCFEKGSHVGGNWVLDNDNGLSSSYRSLHINTSRERMAYADLPMPGRYPDFPHHSHIREYFGHYVDTFGLREHIRFNTGIAHAERLPGGGWELTTEAGDTERFDALVVANGHHWDPRWPDPYPGQGSFTGVQLHAHYFRDNAGWADKVVLIVGMGNSGMDISVEASWVAARTLLSARHGIWIIPKYLFGKPLDQISTGAAARLPWKLRQRTNELILKTVVGRLSRYGLPEPEHGLFQSHPTISDVILSRIAHGEIEPVKAIERFDGDRVVFTDGRREHVDVVVWCTGYTVSFPFFDPELVSAPGNDLPLYRRVFHPQVPDVFFVGLLQPLGAVMPLSEAQGGWIAEHLTGRYALPSPSAMAADIAAEREQLHERYVASARHTMQVDFDSYLHDLGKEVAAGRKRAAAAGHPRPVPAQTALA